jgi:dephospho-CoA kinase
MVETVKDFYLIGLTGNLGCGKSTVRRILEQLGARGIDADLLAHAAMERGTPAWGAIVKTFGPDTLRYDGEIDRQSLSKRVFADPEALSRLEQILHPAVGDLVKQILRENVKPVVVLEAIKLIESGLHHWCDALWVVTCSSEDQVERVVRDRQMRPEDARARLDAQSAQDEKTRLANVVIDNSGDISKTGAQVQKAWAETVHVESARDKSAWLFDKPAPSQPSPPPPPVAEAPAPEPAPPPAPAPTPEPEPKATSISPPTPTPPVAPEQPTEKTAQIPERRPTPPPQRPPPLPRDLLVQVRPARRADMDALSKTLAQAEGKKEPLSPAETLKRLGERGYRIALAQGRIVAIAAWEAENLVAVTRDIRAESPEIARQAFPPLLSLIEQDANSLVCEVSILLVDARTPSIVSNVASASGYRVSDLDSLYKVWRQVISERLREGEKIWVKPLRKELITRPIE